MASIDLIVGDVGDCSIKTNLTGFGWEFRALRISKGLRLYDISLLTGFTAFKLSNMEFGKNNIAPQVLKVLVNKNIVSFEQYSRLLKSFNIDQGTNKKR